MTTARSTQPQVLELDALLAGAVVVVVELDVVVVGRARVVVVAGSDVVVVVGGTVVVVGASVVVVMGGASVVVVSAAVALPDRRPSRTGVAARARSRAAAWRMALECIGPAYDQPPGRSGDRGRVRPLQARRTLRTQVLPVGTIALDRSDLD
jgi:hypothetical protein